MKLRNLSYIIILFVFWSCSNSTEHVERIDQEFTIVTDSIESMMPGRLFVYADYVIWHDALGKEGCVHVLEKTTGKELTKFVDVGQGPEEFVTPSVGYIQNNKVFIYDPNLDKVAYYSLDADNFNVEFSKIDRVRGETRYQEIDGEVLSFNPSLEKPFKWKNTYWGKTFFDSSITNSYDVAQGNVLYNPYNQSLVYSVMSYHYMSLYKVKNGNIELVSERIGNVDYDIVNDEVKLNRKREGHKEMALTADYIVILERDYAVDDTDEFTVSRDFSKLPQTVFLYDYDLTLKKILNFGVPVLRLAADPKNNTLYAIVVDPDFMLVKCELK